MDVGILSSQQNGHSNDGFLGESIGEDAADAAAAAAAVFWALATRCDGVDLYFL